METLSPKRLAQILTAAAKTRILVIGDAMLDHFIWGKVGRISPEAPVPVVDFQRETFMPGGAANVARNLTSLQVQTSIIGAIGRHPGGVTAMAGKDIIFRDDARARLLRGITVLAEAVRITLGPKARTVMLDKG